MSFHFQGFICTLDRLNAMIRNNNLYIDKIYEDLTKGTFKIPTIPNHTVTDDPKHIINSINFLKNEFDKLNITETDNALHEMTEKYNLKTDRQVADKIRQLCDSDDPQKKLFNNLSGIINTFYPDTVTDEQSLLLFIFDLIKQSYKPETTDKNNRACLLTKSIIPDNTEV